MKKGEPKPRLKGGVSHTGEGLLIVESHCQNVKIVNGQQSCLDRATQHNRCRCSFTVLMSCKRDSTINILLIYD